MNVKKVVIKGFKAYNDTTIFGPFSNTRNCIVGLNGSGKSSLFDAIEFVLLDDYSNLSKKDITSILYHGKETTSNAYVEIVFDNSENFYPNERDEVTIRRAFGIHKNEYFIDRKHASRADIDSLLEAAGIPQGQGSFLIKQGRVKDVSHMSDLGRLGLLLDVSGVKVYDQKRSDSIRLLAESAEKHNKLENSIYYIEDKLKELNEEVEELHQFEEITRKKKALEYIFYDRKRVQAEEELSTIDEIRVNENEVLIELRKQQNKIKDQIDLLKRERDSTQDEYNNYCNKREDAIKERSNLIEKKTKASLKIKKTNKSLEELTKEINQKKINDEKLNSKFQKASQKRDELIDRCQRLRVNISERIAKISPPMEFISTKNMLNRIEKDIGICEESISSTDNELLKLNSKVEKLSEQIEQLKFTNQEIESKLHLEKENYYKLLDMRKENWRKENDLKKKFLYIKDTQSTSLRILQQRMGADVLKVKEMLKEQPIEGIYGPLIDLISFQEELCLAIDATARGYLFYMMADTEEALLQLNTAAKKNGINRVSVILLPRAAKRCKHASIPTTPTIRPLLSEITILNDHILPAVELAFGKWAICPTLTAATDECSLNKVDCVTVDGDRVFCNGTMTGGYHNSAYSPTLLHTKIKKFTTNLDNTKSSLTQAQLEIERATQQLQDSQKSQSKLISDLTDSSQQLNMAIMKREDLRIKTENLTNHKNSLIEELNELKLNSEECKAQLAIFDSGEISEEERNQANDELSTLNNQLFEAKMSLGAATNRCAELSAQIRRSAEISLSSAEKLQQKIEKLKNILNKDMEPYNQKISEFDSKISDLRNALFDQDRNIEALKIDIDTIQEKIKYQQNAFELHTARSLLVVARRDDAAEKVGAISPFPAAEVSGFEGLSGEKIAEELALANSELKLFRHLNRKADEQFSKLSAHRANLNRQLEELDGGHESIMSLIKGLDNNRQTAFEAFFAKVSDFFSKTVDRIAPDLGGAHLVLQRAADPDDMMSSETPLTGVAVRLSGHLDLRELSGGQRTVIAVSLLLAVQRASPAPFYVLDEADSDLDPQHRRALAQLIVESSEAHSQFFYATFRPELAEVADRAFGVKSGLNGSSVREIDEKEVSNFFDTLP